VDDNLWGILHMFCWVQKACVHDLSELVKNKIIQKAEEITNFASYTTYDNEICLRAWRKRKESQELIQNSDCWRAFHWQKASS
jgi:hypothetical protein